MRHKHADLIIAWANGAKIQTYRLLPDEWIDTFAPAWVEDSRYRIKPEPKPDVVEYYRLGKHHFLRAIREEGGYTNLKVTFDAETGELKAAEVLK